MTTKNTEQSQTKTMNNKVFKARKFLNFLKNTVNDPDFPDEYPDNWRKWRLIVNDEFYLHLAEVPDIIGLVPALMEDPSLKESPENLLLDPKIADIFEFHLKKIKEKETFSNKINDQMVNTFKREARMQHFIALASIVGIGIMLFTMFYIGRLCFEGFIDKTITADSSGAIILILRLFMIVPIAWAIFFLQHRYHVASILSAEYRHKQATVEAMIGYNAKYPCQDHNYGHKAFDEISKNSADKINQMIINRDSANSEMQKKIIDIVTKEIETIIRKNLKN